MSASVLRVTPANQSAARTDLSTMQRSINRGDWMSTGDRGDDVKALQRALKQRGFYTGPVDGEFGPVTDRAVRGYQAANGQFVDGKVGPSTLKELRADTKMVGDHFETSAHRGEAGKDILRMERRLKDLGYSVGAVDGVFDASTQAAVTAFRGRSDALNDDHKGINAQFEREVMKANAPRAPALPPGETAPPSDYHRINFRGVTVNTRTKVMVERAEAEMAKLGHPGFKFSFAQGSYSHSVSASAGTHDGGGALDVRDAGLPRGTVDDMVVALRRAGFAAWSRGRGHDSFPPHIHAIAIGDRELSSSARNQVREYFAGGDGLVGSSADPDRSLGRPVPAWARRFR